MPGSRHLRNDAQGRSPTKYFLNPFNSVETVKKGNSSALDVHNESMFPVSVDRHLHNVRYRSEPSYVEVRTTRTE